MTVAAPSYRPYTAASTFNKPIPPSPPIHPGTSKMISAVDHWMLGGTPYDQYKEWLGPRSRCLYFRGDTASLPHVQVYVNYVSGKGYVCASSPKMSVPMPSWFVPILQGKVAGVSRDLIVVIVDSKTGDLWEMWKATPLGIPSQNITCPSNRWNAITCNHFAADTISHTGYDAVSAVSESYIHMPAGLLVPEDFAGGEIEHAIGFFTRTDQSGAGPFPPHVPPAKAGKGSEYYGIPYGGRVQLDPSINVATHASVVARPEPWRTALAKILRAMQTHGLILMDGTGGIGAGGYSAAHPASVIQGSYNGKTGFKYPWDGMAPYAVGVPADLMARFRVIDWTKWTGV